MHINNIHERVLSIAEGDMFFETARHPFIQLVLIEASGGEIMSEPSQYFVGKRSHAAHLIIGVIPVYDLGVPRE
jgi:hypothetical protein